jgi:hypothetical protein
MFTDMGFPESVVQEALGMVSDIPNQLLQIESIIDLLVRGSLHDRRRPSAAGGGMAAIAPPVPAAGRGGAAALQPSALSGQTEVVSGNLWKQRHIWGFPLQSIEQVEVTRMLTLQTLAA